MSGAAIAGMFAGTHVELVGVEADPKGGLRLYVGYQPKRIYAHVDDPAVVAEIREAWARTSQRFTIPKPPPDCLFCDEEEAVHVG